VTFLGINVRIVTFCLENSGTVDRDSNPNFPQSVTLVTASPVSTQYFINLSSCYSTANLMVNLYIPFVTYKSGLKPKQLKTEMFPVITVAQVCVSKVMSDTPCM